MALISRNFCIEIDDSRPQKLLNYKRKSIATLFDRNFRILKSADLEDALRALDGVENGSRLLKITAHPRRCCGP